MVPLESSNLFTGLSAAELQRVREVAQEKTFSSGQIIFREGDLGDGIYVIKSGLVQITTLVGQGDRRVISQVKPGEMFGEMAVMDNDPRSATATVSELTEVYFIPREAMIMMLENSPRLSVSLVREISRRLRDFNRQYVREVIHAERLALVGRFASTIVHDLKNPLNIIGIASEIAGMESATAETRLIAKQRIRKQVDRINIMVSEILEYTRGGQTSAVLALTDYATFIHQIIEDIRPEVELRSASIVLENTPPSVKVPMDPQRLSRVFYNLLHNATDAMSNGGVIKLRFSTTPTHVVTDIGDTGPGIAPEILEHLFEPFCTHGKSKGTGLGLSICRKIVEDHRGQISADNDPKGGALFSFTLPIQK